MSKVLAHGKIAAGIAVVLGLVWAFVVEVTQIMPDNAEVMVDDVSQVYYSPMYFYDTDADGWQRLRLTTAAEARKRNYRPDPKCRDGGYFVHEKGTQFWAWLDQAGIIKQRKRWNPDGSWNW